MTLNHYCDEDRRFPAREPRDEWGDHDDGSHRRYTLDVSYDDTGRTTQFNQQEELLPAGGGTPIPVAASTRNETYSYASGHRHQVSSIGTTTYGFDLNANQRTEKRAGSPTRLFNWDEEDRLSSVEHDGDVTSFLSDASPHAALEKAWAGVMPRAC